MKRLLCIFFAILLILAGVQGSSSINKPVALAVTIYNDNFAMVKDTRSISFDQGKSDLYFTDVSSNIETETVTFKAVQKPEDITVFEQNYEANLVSPEEIMKKYIEQEVHIWVKLGDRSIKVTGTLLGYNKGYILETSTGVTVYDSIDAIQFAKLPEGFFTKPTLNWKVFSREAVTTDCEVAYRTKGFSWKSDYTVVLGKKQKKADVGAWVTINNRSGKKYKNTKLKLIAGDVNIVNPAPVPMLLEQSMISPLSFEMFQRAPTFSSKSFSDFHLYTLSDPVTLNDKSQKQIQFIPKIFGMKIRKYNELSISTGTYNQRNRKVTNKIEIENTKENQLGIALPKGTVRVFKEDEDDGSLQFIGQDSIDHTPKDQTITLNTGNSFDIVADKIVVRSKRFPKPPPPPPRVINTNTNGTTIIVVPPPATPKEKTREDMGGYQADVRLDIWNHKTIETEIVIEISNYQGSNLKFDWKTPGLNVENVSSRLTRITRVFAANQKFTIEWSEDYIQFP